MKDTKKKFMIAGLITAILLIVQFTVIARDPDAYLPPPKERDDPKPSLANPIIDLTAASLTREEIAAIKAANSEIISSLSELNELSNQNLETQELTLQFAGESISFTMVNIQAMPLNGYTFMDCAQLFAMLVALGVFALINLFGSIVGLPPASWILIFQAAGLGIGAYLMWLEYKENCLDPILEQSNTLTNAIMDLVESGETLFINGGYVEGSSQSQPAN